MNEVDYNTNSFYRLPKIQKSQLIATAIKQQNSEVFNIKEPQDLKVKPVVVGPKFPTRKLSQSIDILLKPFLKHGKSYIRDSINFLYECDRNTDENANFWCSSPIHNYTVNFWNEGSKVILVAIGRRYSSDV